MSCLQTDASDNARYTGLYVHACPALPCSFKSKSGIFVYETKQLHNAMQASS